MAIGLSCGISSTNYGSEMEEMTIPGGSFRQGVIKAIKDSNIAVSFAPSLAEKEVLMSKLASLSTFTPRENTLENEWLMLRKKALLDMIKICEDDSKNVNTEKSVDKLHGEALEEQWVLIQKTIRSARLMNHLRNLYLIYVDQRNLEQTSKNLTPESLEQFSQLEAIKPELTLREKIVECEFLVWFDDASQHDSSTKAELDFLNKIGVLPLEDIESLRREVYCYERSPESVSTE